MEIPNGYGLLWYAAFDENKLVDVEPEIIEVSAATIFNHFGDLCVKGIKGSVVVPIECFAKVDDLVEDDTYDFRNRFFETYDEAKSFMESEFKSWRNQQPAWKSFVRFQ